MAEASAIEWTDGTWSPCEGCTKVGPGCDHCYAEGMNKWLRKGENWGPGAPRRIYSEEHWAKPIKWQRDATKFDTLHQRHRRVFPSVCDPFDNEASDFLRQRFFGLIRLTPSIDWLLLTKRIGNAKSMLPKDWGDGYPNVWLGATVVNQEEADRDIPKLMALSARVRFLSIEPMLGPINLHGMVVNEQARRAIGALPGIDWIIAGGESGREARPAHPDWFRSLRDQCKAAGVPFLFKQWGEWAPGSQDFRAGSAIALDGRIAADGFDRASYPAGADSADGWTMVHRAGKKIAGRLLDGKQHDGFPQPSPKGPR